MVFSHQIAEALQWAGEQHVRQRRKLSDAPYVSHLMATAALVMEFGGTESEIVAALLHDAIEDQGGLAAEREIRERFGDDVADIVVACSDTHESPKPPWRARKEAHLEHVATASDSVRMVVAADKLDNARSLLVSLREHGPAVWSHFRGGREGTLWYFRRMLAVLGSKPMPGRGDALLEELACAVALLETSSADGLENERSSE